MKLSFIVFYNYTHILIKRLCMIWIKIINCLIICFIKYLLSSLSLFYPHPFFIFKIDKISQINNFLSFLFLPYIPPISLYRLNRAGNRHMNPKNFATWDREFVSFIHQTIKKLTSSKKKINYSTFWNGKSLNCSRKLFLMFIIMVMKIELSM